MERGKEGSGMGSFDGPIKLTFSLDAHRTVITKVVGKKRREEVRKEGRRLKSDEALSLSFNPIVLASERASSDSTRTRRHLVIG